MSPLTGWLPEGFLEPLGQKVPFFRVWQSYFLSLINLGYPPNISIQMNISSKVLVLNLWVKTPSNGLFIGIA